MNDSAAKSQKDSIQFFFQSFANHLRRIRDDGTDTNQSYRAQILLGQLQLFEKAVREHQGNGEGGPGGENLREFLAIRDLPSLVHWLRNKQDWLPRLTLFYLNTEGIWECLGGREQMPETPRIGAWLERGLLARLYDPEHGYLFYINGAPRVVMIPDMPENLHREDADLFASFLAACLPMWITGKVKAPLKAPKKGRMKLIANDPVFLEKIAEIEQAAQKDITILLEGESGTGKEVLAQFIHSISPRVDKPLVTVNCAAIPAGLIESELFGHEKGSFTNAVNRHIGSVEQADGGTLFLDEIGEMEIAMQAKLLRFLQLREFHRVGGRSKIAVNVRVVAATNRDLKEEVKRGNFREDLYYRISAMPVSVPPLRQRVDDIAPLMRFFVRKYSIEYKTGPLEIDESIYRYLAAYDFPGNVRELENMVQKILVTAQNKITPADLPDEIRGLEPKGVPVTDEKGRVRKWRVSAPSKKIGLSLVMPAIQPDVKNGAKEETRAEGELHPWEQFLPRNNTELKAAKEQIQEYAKELTLNLERRFLEDLLDKTNGSILDASQMAEVNRTLLYKMMERTGLKD